MCPSRERRSSLSDLSGGVVLHNIGDVREVQPPGCHVGADHHAFAAAREVQECLRPYSLQTARSRSHPCFFQVRGADEALGMAGIALSYPGFWKTKWPARGKLHMVHARRDSCE